MKKNLALKFPAIIVGLVSCFAFAACANDVTDLKITSPQNGETVKITMDNVKNYLDAVHADLQTTKVVDYRASWKAQDVVLSWEASKKAAPFEIKVSQSEDMTNAKTFTTSETSYSLSNLYAATSYYWSVKSSDGQTQSGNFKTQDTVRFIKVDGTANVRDLGNYTTKDGKKVKQGLVYRGAELNNTYNVKPAGVTIMLDELGIKTDLDLRWANETSKDGTPLTASPLGATVTYCNKPIAPYGEMNIDVTENDKNANYPVYTKESMQYIFKELLTEEASYPLYFHCQGGADRTGCLAFLINGMLGVDYVDLLADYELTSFSAIVRSTDKTFYKDTETNFGVKYEDFINMIKTYGTSEDDWQTLCTSYLKEFVEVTDSELNKIKSILLDE